MARVAKPLAQMGAQINGRDGGNKAPLAIAGQALSGSTIRTPVASAQVKVPAAGGINRQWQHHRDRASALARPQRTHAARLWR